jgi:hypothetical protein
MESSNSGRLSAQGAPKVLDPFDEVFGSREASPERAPPQQPQRQQERPGSSGPAVAADHSSGGAAAGASDSDSETEEVRPARAGSSGPRRSFLTPGALSSKVFLRRIKVCSPLICKAPGAVPACP